MRLVVNTVGIASVISAIWQTIDRRIAAAVVLGLAALAVAVIRHRF
jgi:hypothetical protein